MEKNKINEISDLLKQNKYNLKQSKSFISSKNNPKNKLQMSKNNVNINIDSLKNFDQNNKLNQEHSKILMNLNSPRNKKLKDSIRNLENIKKIFNNDQQNPLSLIQKFEKKKNSQSPLVNEKTENLTKNKNSDKERLDKNNSHSPMFKIKNNQNIHFFKKYIKTNENKILNLKTYQHLFKKIENQNNIKKLNRNDENINNISDLSNNNINETSKIPINLNYITQNKQNFAPKSNQRNLNKSENLISESSTVKYTRNKQKIAFNNSFDYNSLQNVQFGFSFSKENNDKNFNKYKKENKKNLNKMLNSSTNFQNISFEAQINDQKFSTKDNTIKASIINKQEVESIEDMHFVLERYIKSSKKLENHKQVNNIHYRDFHENILYDEEIDFLDN